MLQISAVIQEHIQTWSYKKVLSYVSNILLYYDKAHLYGEDTNTHTYMHTNI